MSRRAVTMTAVSGPPIDDDARHAKAVAHRRRRRFREASVVVLAAAGLIVAAVWGTSPVTSPQATQPGPLSTEVPSPPASPTAEVNSPSPTATAATSATASQGPSSTGITVLAISPHTGVIVGTPSRCIDNAEHLLEDGNPVTTYMCHSGINQYWTYGADSTLQQGGFCLGRASSGTLVQLRSCDGSGYQRWQFRSDGSLLNVGSGLCLWDPAAGGNAAPAPYNTMPALYIGARAPTLTDPQLELAGCVSGGVGQHWIFP